MVTRTLPETLSRTLPETLWPLPRACAWARRRTGSLRPLRPLSTWVPETPPIGESGHVDYLLTSTVQVSNLSTASHRARARGQFGKAKR